MPSDEEMANLQRLSNDYVPDVQGDLVGRRQSTQAITLEYAQADPIYVHKTARLPEKYSHYRTVRGDGNCGWRALAYGYFEALLRAGDPMRIQSEIVRLKSLNNLLNAVGNDPMLYEDFVEETFDLLERTRVDLPCLDDGAMLLASFNDVGITGSIITHFRLITSAWLRTNAHQYQDFLQDSTIDQYCRTKIDPYQVEIENLGLQALLDAIIKPAGIDVDVTYLDRSPNEEVNTLSWQGEDTGYGPIPTIRLLYRPGHYDILYKIGDVPTVSQVHNMSYAPIYGQANSHYSNHNLDLDQMSLYIPGLSTSGISSGVSTDIPTSYPHDAYPSAFTSHSLHHPRLSSEPYAVPNYPPVRSTPRTSPIVQPPPIETNIQDSFRQSKFQLEPAYRQLRTVPLEPCQTDAMLSAGADIAHYMNEDFQPQLWEPGSEYRGGRETTSQSRRGS